MPINRYNRYLPPRRRRIVITSLTRAELMRELQGTRSDLRDARQEVAELEVLEADARRALRETTEKGTFPCT